MHELTNLIESLISAEGINATDHSGISIYKSTQHYPRQPILYEQGVIFVVQGTKKVYLKGREYLYDKGKYLALSVPLQADCAAFASEQEPFLALFMKMDLAMVNLIISEMDEALEQKITPHEKEIPALFVAHCDTLLQETLIRLLRALQTPTESRILAPALVKELMYRVIIGENAQAIRELAFKNTNLSKMNRVLRLMHESYSEPVDVNALAAMVNMSASTFHRAFKELTATSPIQYLKKVRLSSAKTLLIDQNLRVNQVAIQVGYESASQFSREFKKHFGCSPVDAKAVFVGGSGT